MDTVQIFLEIGAAHLCRRGGLAGLVPGRPRMNEPRSRALCDYGPRYADALRAAQFEWVYSKLVMRHGILSV